MALTFAIGAGMWAWRGMDMAAQGLNVETCEDPQDLFNKHRTIAQAHPDYGSWDGQAQLFLDKQSNLRKLIQDDKKLYNCPRPEGDPWRQARRQPPSRPAPWERSNMPSTDLLQTVRRTSLELLRAQCGVLWRDVQGELQLAYEEMPTWILLYENSDVRAAHEVLCAALKPVMEQIEPVQFTVSYAMRTEEFDITLESLMDNDEICEALDRADFATVPNTRARAQGGVFGAQLSGMRPGTGLRAWGL